MLDLNSANASDCENVQLWHLNWSYAQQWKLAACGNGYYYISSRVNENYRLDAIGGPNASGIGQNLGVYHAADYDGQKFKIDFLDREDYLQVQWSNNVPDGDNPEPNNFVATRFVEYYGNGATGNDNARKFYGYAATSDVKVEKDLFKKTGYTLTHYDTRSDDKGSDYNEGDTVPDSACAALTLLRNVSNYNLAIKQTNSNVDSTLWTVWNDYQMCQWWSFLKADKDNAYYIINQATGQVLASDKGVVKTKKWNGSDSTQLWELELDTANQYRISIYGKNEYLTMRDDNFVYTTSSFEQDDSDYDYQMWNIDGVSIDLYAQWTPNNYTIHFEKVLGEAVTNVPDDITAVYDKAVTIPDNIPVRTGFTFTGWALIENASADIISPGSTVKNLTTTDGAVVNLYAQWKQRKLVIVKASSTMYNDTIIRRTAGDDEWYNSVGKLGIQDLKNYPDDKCVQVWKIDKNGNITQTK